MKALFTRLFGNAKPAVDRVELRDAPAIARLHGLSFHRGWSETEIDQLIAERNIMAHGLRVKRRLAGFVMSRLAADQAEILSIAIDPAWRGRGLSGLLLQTHLGYVAGAGARAVFLEVEENNAPAVRLYTKAGFRTVGRREQYYRAADGKHLNALIMERVLS